MAVCIPRLLSPFLSKTKPFLLQHHSTISILLLSHFRLLSTTPPPPPPSNLNPNPRTRSLTPLEMQFETRVSRLGPGFTSADVDAALRDQSDPDLALDIFRWTSLQPGYRHSPSTYHTMLHISVYMVLICRLAMVGRFEESIRVLFDMLENSLRPDILTYWTVLEGMCREGQTEEAFKLLEKLGSNTRAMDRKVYSDWLDGLHWLCNLQD